MDQLREGGRGVPDRLLRKEWDSAVDDVEVDAVAPMDVCATAGERKESRPDVCVDCRCLEDVAITRDSLV